MDGRREGSNRGQGRRAGDARTWRPAGSGARAGVKRGLAVGFVLGVVLAVAGCRREPTYSQATPDDVVQSAKLMVKAGRADRLTGLLYAENEDLRVLYTKLGRLLRSVQELALVMNEKFPKEIQELRAKAEQAANEGKATSLLGGLTGEARRSARRAARGEERNPGDALNATLKQLLADPYGWLDEHSSKLSTAYISDEASAVLWDRKPVFPPLGLVMKKDGDRWFVVPPTNMPVLSSVMPKTKDEFTIWGSLVRTVDNAVQEVTRDVKAGKLRSLDEVARAAGEKAFVPVGIGVIAYGRAVEIRKQEARQAQKAREAAKGAAALPKTGP